MIVPGPRFGVHEQQLFAALTAIARRAELRPAEAQRMCADIEAGLACADPEGTLARAIARLPQLAAFSPHLANSAARQARVLRMLETILNALSVPSKWATFSSAPASPASPTATRSRSPGG